MRVRASRPRADRSGGAVSLFVILMVPVSVFAAVVATAVPQRLAAESSLEEAAADLAVLAAAWRDAQGRDHGRLDAYFPDCDFAPLQLGIGHDPAFASDLQRACVTLTHAVLADLGGRGFDPATIGGFYSSSLSTAAGGPAGWRLPCTATGGTLVADAAHVGLLARWTGPGWAAAQAIPDGVPMGAEAIGRIARGGEGRNIGVLHPPCGASLRLVPERLAPRSGADRSSGRELADTVPTRTAFSG